MSSEPRRLNDSLDAVVRAMKGPSAQAVAGVFGQWESLVGDHVAAHVRPVVIDGSTLVVEVDEPGWATQLRYLERELLDRVQPATGGTLLTTLKVRVKRR
jgi:predicted nucleic acid-binding Zn ribbon protein